ncbi:MAG: ABC transporter permease [Nitriliruptor sp.]|nr:MAG: ABC transporter permease [Nitriliruptor sp.]
MAGGDLPQRGGREHRRARGGGRGGGVTARSDTRSIRLVARREVWDRLRSRTFLSVTALLVVVVAAAIIVPSVIGTDGPTRHDLALVAGETDDLEVPLETNAAANDIDLRFHIASDRAAAVEVVEAGDADAALVAGPELLSPNAGIAPPLKASVDAAVAEATFRQGFTDAGIDATEVLAILREVEPVPVADIGGGDGLTQADIWLAFGLTALLIVAVQFNGTTLLNSAVEEKGSRVVEVLLGSLRPWQLLTGKLAATALVATLQLALIVAVALASNALVGAVDLPAATPLLIVVSLVMVIAGFLFYGAVYLVAGSMASSSEEAQTALAPLLVLLMGSYFAVLFLVLPEPSGTAAVVLSLLPPSAPFTIPPLLVFGALPTWQLLTGLAATIIAAALAVRLAGRLYSAAVLSGGTLSWREVWQAEPIP